MNILLITLDQFRGDCLSSAGHPLVQTPNLDAPARRGTRFTDAYTPWPICVPARASLATGRWVHDIGYWDNAMGYDGREPGWGHTLQAAGVRVESIGKLHYRRADDPTGFEPGPDGGPRWPDGWESDDDLWDRLHIALTALARLVPDGDPLFEHVAEGSDDMPAHVKASLLGSSVSIPVKDGRLLLGTWQGIYFCEFDGPRSRQCWIKCLPSGVI